MRFGVVFPQTEIGTDPITIRDYAQAAEELGYHHILAYDHVIGASLASRPGWHPPYTHQSTFHEPFVLFGYLAGLTKKISAAKIKKSDRTTDIFIRSPAPAGVAAKRRNSFGDIFHHH